VIVVDDDIDVRDGNELVWAIANHVDPARDTLLIDRTPIDVLDFAGPEAGLGSRLGLDATRKWPGETDREWPDTIAADASVEARMQMLCEQVCGEFAVRR
jgi:4-hydroxy-3-polyprenylbenzoate decarboxylase